MEPGNKIAGVVSLKHVYEIAKFKSDEINCASRTLKQLCISVINTANMMGIKIVKDDIDYVELAEFLEKRNLINEEEIKTIAEKKAAKLMRAANIAAAAAAAASAEKDKKK